VDLRNVTTIGSASGMARLLLVVAALTGFLAMHGLATTDAAGAHHLGSISVQHDAGVAVPGASSHDAMATEAEAAPEQEPAQHDAVMAGCVFVLLAVAGTLALRALWVTAARCASARTVLRALSHGPARAPPCPVFVFLCVFRL
jgi:hypothetical protein